MRAIGKKSGVSARGVDNFFGQEAVSRKDEVVFTFGKKTYTAVTNILMITKRKARRQSFV
jgi:hypothetical protein